MKIIKWIGNNILFVITLFLLAFIPLFPKLPLLDIKNTWVYIRAEDFVIAFTLLAWLILLIRKKITLKTPLTMPILLFWIIGAVSTIHAVLLVFPVIAIAYPNVAFLSFLRRIEYLSLFFIAYGGIYSLKVPGSSLFENKIASLSQLSKWAIRIPSVIYIIIFGGELIEKFRLSLPFIYERIYFFNAIGIIVFCIAITAILLTLFKNILSVIIASLVTTLLLVTFYGFGQRYLDFPAYLTMNEEFAKGEPIRLSALSRLPSTFAGHYDLAAYLVLILPILTSLIFGFRNWIVKVILAITVSLGFILLFMTVSRVSFFVLLIALGLVFLFQRKKIILLFLPVLLILMAFLLVRFAPSLTERFGDTVKEVDILVDAQTGEAIGHVKFVPSANYSNKDLRRRNFFSKDQFDKLNQTEATSQAIASKSAIVLPEDLLSELILVTPQTASTGESLPQGTEYINLPLAPVTRRTAYFLFENPKTPEFVSKADAFVFYGDFLVKKASAYDLSFTTRFQGEWPHAINAFKRNILFGTGYSSISLAIDNNYLRILGEVGLLGFISFFSIFIFAGIYIFRILPSVDSKIVRSFTLGFVAGVSGLMLNAILIDVYEASKVAFVLWLLTGITLGILHLYQTKQLDLYKEFIKVVISPVAIILYLAVMTILVFSPLMSNYFVGDDYTWLRWVAQDQSQLSSLPQYFTEANGFFYRPGTKVFFSLMYQVFWLNQTVYHIASLLLHFTVAVLVFLLGRKVLRNHALSIFAAFLFLILSGYSETVFWISSIGFLFNAVFVLLGMLSYIHWEEKKNILYFIFSIICIVLGLLFHELGIVAPLLFIMYSITSEGEFNYRKLLKKIYYLWLFVPIGGYLFIRYLAQSHWLSGDYNYNIFKLPFNFIGNSIGYIMLALFGPISIPLYNNLRANSRENMIVSGAIIIVATVIFLVIYRKIIAHFEKDEKRIVAFGVSFFVIALLPFLGLGNITSRYSYLASVGFVFIFVFFINKVYGYLRYSGDKIALASVSVVVALFYLFHIIQLQDIHNDWRNAGQKARKFFIAVDGLYYDYWTKEPMIFYFVNVPISEGKAWVFPVGLDDALWFAFRNPQITVIKASTKEEALSLIRNPRNEKVFEFDENEKLIERKNPPITP